MACHRPARYPCGRCGGCLAKRASDWSIRLAHEKKFHEACSFITLTFTNDEVLDVSKEDSVDFMKRLRKRLAPEKIRFYLVAEYGDKNKRPHYHAIIFGHDFSKDEGARIVRKGLYSSPLLEAAWGLGHVSSGEVTDASIRYVTNYVLQKEDVPVVQNIETGETRSLAPVFALMSRNPGIGAAWIEQHAEETYRDDTVSNAGFRRQPPRYYDSRTFGIDEAAVKVLRQSRRSAKLKPMLRDAQDWLRNNDPLRRQAEAKIWKSKRSLKPTGEL